MRPGAAPHLIRTAIYEGDGEPVSGWGPEGACQSQKLCAEMVDRKTAVIKVPARCGRVLRVIERTAEPARHRKTARDPDMADRIQTISILQDFCFEGFRLNTGGIAVGFDGMGDAARFVWGPAKPGQHTPGLLRRHARGRRPQRGIFWHIDAIMQKARRRQDFAIAPFLIGNGQNIPPHPAKMGQIMGTIPARRQRKRAQSRRKILIRRKLCSKINYARNQHLKNKVTSFKACCANTKEGQRINASGNHGVAIDFAQVVRREVGKAYDRTKPGQVDDFK